MKYTIAPFPERILMQKVLTTPETREVTSQCFVIQNILHLIDARGFEIFYECEYSKSNKL